MQWPSMALQGKPTTFNMKALTRNTLNGMPGICPALCSAYLKEKCLGFWKIYLIQSCCHSWEWGKFSSIEHMSTTHTHPPACLGWAKNCKNHEKEDPIFIALDSWEFPPAYDRSAGRQRGQGIVEKSVANQFSSFKLPVTGELLNLLNINISVS